MPWGSGLIATAIETVRVLSVAARLEEARTSEGPVPLFARLRAEAALRPRRDPRARQRLKRAIGWVDRCFPGGGNCYRRVLLEVALDAGAAADPVCFGLRPGGGPGSGHAYFRAEGPARESRDQPFEIVFEM